ncbi:MAG: hypothetical protein F4Z66_13890 [Gammaproteobacteria bacterium]|nr:hypothetical protein [Gammaproteobacteria bacterium]
MSTTARWTATRLIDKPIVSARSDPSIGVNIQGPSPIRVPDWIDEPLGKYYLYFADHKGSYIRLAYSDRIEGPWTIHVPGSLHLRDSHFPTVPPQPNGEVTTSTPMKLPHSSHKEYSTPHIASPDVHIDDDNQRMVMYFHGLESYGRQLSRVATSKDGIDFDAYPETIGPTYLRAFTYKNELFAMTMPGQFSIQVMGSRSLNQDQDCLIRICGTLLFLSRTGRFLFSGLRSTMLPREFSYKQSISINLLKNVSRPILMSYYVPKENGKERRSL